MHIPSAFAHSMSSAPDADVLSSADSLRQKQDFFRQIDLWVQELAPGQARDTAAARIKEAYEKKSTELSLKNLGLSSLPTEIGALTSLTAIDISGNQLETLPESIGQLKKLEELHAQSNCLAALPNALCDLSALQVLILSSNGLKSLPNNIGQLSCLELLDVDMNALQTLPESISNLKKLSGLHVNHNFLSNLPGAISQITSLVILNARNNKIDDVPSDIGDMPNLERLDLQNNQLFNISFSLHRIEEVYLENNPVMDVMTAPHRLINFGPGLDKTIFYLQQTCDYIALDGWGIKNSCFINQLLLHAGRFQEAIQSRAMDNTVGFYTQRLRTAYFEIKEIALLIQQARDVDFLYDSQREDIIFMSRDGGVGVIMGKDFYQANILGTTHSGDISWLQFSAYIFDEKNGMYANVPIGDIKKTLEPFPFLQKKFLAVNQLHTLRSFFTQLNLGTYQEFFIDALYGRAPTINLVAPEHQTALIDLFSPVVHHGDNEITITDAHFQTIRNIFPAAANDPASTLFSLAVLMTRYSSQSVFGAELESPVALRHYSLALLNKAVQINPNLIDETRAQNYRDSLLQRNGAQGCTEQLFNQMFSDARDLIAAGNNTLKAAINAVIPSVWR